MIAPIRLLSGRQEKADDRAGFLSDPAAITVRAVNGSSTHGWEFYNRLHPSFPLSEELMQRHVESPEAMEKLGQAAAAVARPGAVIALVGGLGAGKTRWTKGFVAGTGSRDEVTSPTFGLLHEYAGGRFPVFHLDFYRLESAAELIALGWDELLEQGGVIIAEWGDKFPDLLPADSIWLHFTVESDGRRSVSQSES